MKLIKQKGMRAALWMGMGMLASGALAGCGGTGTDTPLYITATPTPEPSSEPSSEYQLTGGQEIQKETSPLSQEELQEAVGYAQSANCFGADLFGALAQEQEGENLLLSSYSVFSALVMLSNGMEDSGARDELMGVLYLQEDGGSYDYEKTVRLLALLNHAMQNNSYAQVALANSVWLTDQLTLSPNFQEFSSRLDSLQAECFRMDLTADTAADAVNAWVDTHTNHMIPRLTDMPYSADTVMVILNAVYFLGKWSEPFNEALTSEQTFYGASGEQTVDMMYMNTELAYRNCGSYQCILLPYEDGEYNMTIYLSATEGITMPELYQSGMLSEAELAQLFGDGREDAQTQQWEYPNVSLSLPRFEMECTTDLNTAVSACGARQIFNDARLTEVADYEYLIGPVNVSEIKQKAKIKVDEQGTEAAAVTSIECTNEAFQIVEHVDFTVDEPFMFTITDGETGVVLFTGIVNQIETE